MKLYNFSAKLLYKLNEDILNVKYTDERNRDG